LIGAALVVSALVTGATAQTTKPELYFVAIGDVPVDILHGLVSHFQTKSRHVHGCDAGAMGVYVLDAERRPAVRGRIVCANGSHKPRHSAERDTAAKPTAEDGHKEHGIMYFGLPASDNPRSALFRSILGVDDLNRMTEDFIPK